MRIAVCDDDESGREHFLSMLSEVCPDARIEEFSSGPALLRAAAADRPFDAAFLDIYMPWEDGMEVARQLTEISPDTGLIFVTSSAEHAVEAFALHALHYLVKPVTADDIREAMRRLDEHKSIRRRRDVLSVSVGRDSCLLYMDEIMYVHSVSHATEIVMADGSVHRVWMTLSDLAKKLNADFLKIQRGIIVNMGDIEQMGTDACVMRDGTKLLLSRGEKQQIRQTYEEYAFSRLTHNKLGG